MALAWCCIAIWKMIFGSATVPLRPPLLTSSLASTLLRSAYQHYPKLLVVQIHQVAAHNVVTIAAALYLVWYFYFGIAPSRPISKGGNNGYSLGLANAFKLAYSSLMDALPSLLRSLS
jgi:hypothetical protein